MATRLNLLPHQGCTACPAAVKEAIRPVAVQLPANTQPAKAHGYTLLELIIIVSILGVIAAIAVPSGQPTDHFRLQQATAAVAEAFRFAREEARRQGSYYGVAVDQSGNRLRVFRLDEGPNPNDTVFDVRQPVSKELYSVQLGAAPYQGATITAVSATAVGSCAYMTDFSFDASGVLRCIDPIASRLENSSIDVSVGILSSTVAIDAITGRVTTQ